MFLLTGQYVDITIRIVGPMIYTVFQKKKTKTFFCSIPYKTWVILMKFGTPFPE